jgi:uncharacterized protein YegL
VTEAQTTSKTEDDRLLVLAFYIAIDVSYSMVQDDAIGAANDLVTHLRDQVAANSVLADMARIGVISFSDEAKPVIPLGDLRTVTQLPLLTVEGGTSYAALFRLLRQIIPGDLHQLRDDGFRTHRPVVFLITDGEPTDDAADLQAAFADLTGQAFKMRPNIVPFGVGAATSDTIDPWVFPPKKMRSFAFKVGLNPHEAIKKLAEILTGSIVESVGSVEEDGESGGFVLPTDDEEESWFFE